MPNSSKGEQPVANVERLLYTRVMAAEMLSISVRSLDHLIAHKRLNARRVGHRVLVPRAELLRFAGKNHTDPIWG